MTSDRRMEGPVRLLCLLAFCAGIQANVRPEFDSDFNVIQLREDLKKGDFAFQIAASDADGDLLTYGAVGPNAAYFNVDGETGSVSIENTLDRETNPTLTLELTIWDHINSIVSKTVTIIVLDANDNKPFFQNAPYDAKVPENAAIDTFLFTATATDIDIGLNAVVKYKIDEVIPPSEEDLFAIHESTGRVTLIGKLNYNSLSRSYQLKINASDCGHLSTPPEPSLSNFALAYITVEDVPDLDPQFMNLPYMTQVEEHSPVGQTVLTVTARDGDFGVNDKMSYSITGEEGIEGLFQINPSTGAISVAEDIDREALLTYQVVLVVKATEINPSIFGYHANTTTEVSISIGDINDNKPEFYNCSADKCVASEIFTVEILEHSSGALPLSITVKDLDQGVNATFELTLGGEHKDAFSVSPPFGISEGQVLIMIRNPQYVDYEEFKSMVLQVIAKDPGNTADCCSTATVTIQIKDDNDNSPVFDEDTYNLVLPEHSPNNTTIATITAKDPDTMDIGKLRYRLLPDSILRYFDVDPKTGRLFVQNSKLIDREVNSVHSVTLQARDTANNTGTAVLVITLSDINDQPPVINREVYNEFVREGPDGHLKLLIQATDRDDPETPNSQVDFAIVESEYSDNFTIGSDFELPNTGILENRGPLDREAIRPLLEGKIELNVTATDRGEPPLSTWVKVIVNVDDINDHAPTFNETSYQFSVQEAKSDAFVGSVFAEDLDQTHDHNRISFRITDGGFGRFIIRTERLDDGLYSGSIFVDPGVELDYEGDRKFYSLDIEASDLGDKTAKVKVEVTVEDVNDERPEFQPAGPLYVTEDRRSGEVGSYKATDVDTNHSLVFELVSTECLYWGPPRPCAEDWFLLEPTGVIRINEEFEINYENCTEVRMEALVVDVYTEHGENSSVNTGLMVINIVDINDNAPEFILSDSMFVIVSASVGTGTVVANVKAMDRDSGINKQIEFEVTSAQFQDSNNDTSEVKGAFVAITSLQGDIYHGAVQSVQQLDDTLKGKYLVEVTARDKGTPTLEATTTLEIFTVDKTSEVELTFSRTVSEIEGNLPAIKIALTAATKTAVHVWRIRDASASKTRESAPDTIMEAYFVYPNGTALNKDQVLVKVSVPEHSVTLGGYGLVHVGTGEPEEIKVDWEMYALLGLVGGLLIVLAVMTTSLVCTRRTYQTKLKAAKAMKSSAMVTTENQKSGPMVPGTNKYTMEGANPVLNLNIDMPADLGFDEDGSNTDRVSLNSLDIDMAASEKDNMPMMMIQEEDEEGVEPDYTESLGAALAQRDRKRDPDSPRLTFNNPAFSTTDL